MAKLQDYLRVKRPISSQTPNQIWPGGGQLVVYLSRGSNDTCSALSRAVHGVQGKDVTHHIRVKGLRHIGMDSMASIWC